MVSKLLFVLNLCLEILRKIQVLLKSNGLQLVSLNFLKIHLCSVYFVCAMAGVFCFVTDLSF